MSGSRGPPSKKPQGKKPQSSSVCARDRSTASMVRLMPSSAISRGYSWRRKLRYLREPCRALLPLPQSLGHAAPLRWEDEREGWGCAQAMMHNSKTNQLISDENFSRNFEHCAHIHRHPHSCPRLAAAWRAAINNPSPHGAFCTAHRGPRPVMRLPTTFRRASATGCKSSSMSPAS